MRIRLPHKATVWAMTGSDGYGSDALGEPRVIDCHWREGSGFYVDEDGRERRRGATVYFDDAVVADQVTSLGADAASSVSPQFRIALGQGDDQGQVRNVMSVRVTSSLDGRRRIVRMTTA